LERHLVLFNQVLVQVVDCREYRTKGKTPPAGDSADMDAVLAHQACAAVLACFSADTLSSLARTIVHQYLRYTNEVRGRVFIMFVSANIGNTGIGSFE
jgi:hypothetical protein